MSPARFKNKNDYQYFFLCKSYEKYQNIHPQIWLHFKLKCIIWCSLRDGCSCRLCLREQLQNLLFFSISERHLWYSRELHSPPRCATCGAPCRDTFPTPQGASQNMNAEDIVDQDFLHSEHGTMFWLTWIFGWNRNRKRPKLKLPSGGNRKGIILPQRVSAPAGFS